MKRYEGINVLVCLFLIKKNGIAVSIKIFADDFMYITRIYDIIHLCTRNTLTQASKNGRKPHLFPQKKFVSVFYANIFNTIYYFKPTNLNCVEKMPFVNSTLFSVLFNMILVYHDLKQKIK